jgi:AcrR family transcriptional regulator
VSSISELAPIGRRERRQQRTRAALVAAGRQLIAEKGPDALTIADVASMADVGFGTFYGYFDSKDALLDAVIDQVLEEIGQRNDALTAGLDDPALVVAVAVRNSMRMALEQPQLAALVVRLGFSGDTRLWDGLHRRMLRDLDAGYKSGRFAKRRRPAAHLVVGGAVMAALRSADLEGDPHPGEVEVPLAESVLAALGLDGADSAAVVAAAGKVLGP